MIVISVTQAEVLRLQQQLKADTKAITGLISVIFKRDLACNFNDVGRTAEAAMRQAKSDAERAGAGACLTTSSFLHRYTLCFSSARGSVCAHCDAADATANVARRASMQTAKCQVMCDARCVTCDV